MDNLSYNRTAWELKGTVNSRIKCGPIVDILGDEMARVMWSHIKNKLLLPFLDMELHVFDLSIASRDKTDDRITLECSYAIRKYNVAVKCATIVPTERRVKDLGLKSMWQSPSDTITKILGGTIFREPIMCKSIPKLACRWTKPIIIARHGYGDEYMAVENEIKSPGKVYLICNQAAGGKPQQLLIHEFRKPGIVMGMFNTDESITEFAHTCFKYALHRKLQLYLTTKNTVLKTYDGRFKDIFYKIFELEYRTAFEDANVPRYEHRLIDDMLAYCLKSEGGFIWACKNYDGDVEADFVAQGYGSIGLMTSVLVVPDGKTIVVEAAHGTVRKHYRLYMDGKETSTNPLAIIFAWIRGLLHRARLDRNVLLRRFAHTLESVCLETIESGYMSKDLAICVKGKTQVQRSDYMETFELIDKMADNLINKLEK